MATSLYNSIEETKDDMEEAGLGIEEVDAYLELW